jgi:hypothetical protein
MNILSSLMAAALAPYRKSEFPSRPEPLKPKTVIHIINGRRTEVQVFRGYNPGAVKALRSKRYAPNGARECARRKK